MVRPVPGDDRGDVADLDGSTSNPCPHGLRDEGLHVLRRSPVDVARREREVRLPGPRAVALHPAVVGGQAGGRAASSRTASWGKRSNCAVRKRLAFDRCLRSVDAERNPGSLLRSSYSHPVSSSRTAPALISRCSSGQWNRWPACLRRTSRIGQPGRLRSVAPVGTGCRWIVACGGRLPAVAWIRRLAARSRIGQPGGWLMPLPGAIPVV